MARSSRKPNAPAGRLRQNQPPALLVGRAAAPPPGLGLADIVDCFRLTRNANGGFTLTLQFRDGRLRRLRLSPAYLRPLQRALAAAARRWFGHGKPPAPDTVRACRCAEASGEGILREVHVHALKDAVVVSLGSSEGTLNAAFEAARAHALEVDLRRLAGLKPPAG